MLPLCNKEGPLKYLTNEKGVLLCISCFQAIPSHSKLFQGSQKPE